MNTDLISVRVTPQLKKELFDHAKDYDTSVSNILRQMVYSIIQSKQSYEKRSN